MESIDTIVLEGMVFFGRHGASDHEKAMGQNFEVDVEIEADLSKARQSDDLGDTIDYGEVYEIVKGVVEGPSMNLIERVADEVAKRLTAQFNPDAVRVRVTKPELPVRGGVLTGGVSVEVCEEA